MSKGVLIYLDPSHYPLAPFASFALRVIGEVIRFEAWNLLKSGTFGAWGVLLIRTIALMLLSAPSAGISASPLLAQNTPVPEAVQQTSDVVPPSQVLPESTEPAIAPPPVVNIRPVDPRTPIIDDEEFDKAIPSLDDAPLESVEQWQVDEEAKEQTGAAAAEQVEQTAEEQANPALRDGDAVEILADPPVTDPMLDEPLPPIESFDAEPPPEPTQAADDREPRAVRYLLRLEGLDPASSPDIATNADGDVYRNARNRFYDLSALDDGDGRADSRAEVNQRARADRQLPPAIIVSEGFFAANHSGEVGEVGLVARQVGLLHVLIAFLVTVPRHLARKPYGRRFERTGVHRAGVAADDELPARLTGDFDGRTPHRPASQPPAEGRRRP